MKHRPSYTKTRPTVPPWRTKGEHRTPARVARASSVASLLARVVTR